MNALVDLFSPGFDILGVPCNQFGKQEPGTDDELLNGLSCVRPGGGFTPAFPLTAKTEVNGENEHPLFTFLKASCPPTSLEMGTKETLFYDPLRTTDITWNFEKILIDAHGRPRYRFHHSVSPSEIERYIAELIVEDI